MPAAVTRRTADAVGAGTSTTSIPDPAGRTARMRTGYLVGTTAARRGIVGFCVRMRAQKLEHPFLVPLVLTRPDIRSDHPESVGLIRFVLEGAGVDPALVPAAFNALAAFILGFVALETSTGDDPDRTREFGALLALEDAADLDQRFEIGVRALVDGLARASSPG